MISTLERVLFLKSVDLFHTIPSEELVRITRIIEELEIRAGESLFREGDPGETMFLIVSGAVEIEKGGKTIAHLGPRECVGEMAILDAAPRSASVRALEDTHLLRIQTEDFHTLLSERHEIALGIIRVLTQRIRTLEPRA